MAATKYLIIIAGPTAIGKTELSLKVAAQYSADIISSDSRQYYRELSIGTAKPTPEERGGIEHHFIDSLSITDDYSIGKFDLDVIDRLNTLYQTQDIAVMTGGSGMHIRAVTHGLDEFPDVPQMVRDRWEAIFQEEGLVSLQKTLKAQDPTYAAIVDMQNSRRLIRALSVIEVSGQPFSAFLNQPQKERIFQPIYIMLERDRAELYERIDRRVDQMISQGLEAEARQYYTQRHLQALNTIGYKEWFEHFDGDIDHGKAIDLIKRNSRRYAKRQMTWFRKETYWNRFSPADEDKIMDFIDREIK